MSVGYGSGVGKERVIRWDLRSQAFGVHASAASFFDLSVASPVEMPHLGLGVAIIQAQLTQAANASMGHLAENIYNMGVANATQGHTVAAPGETQLHILVAVATDQGHTSTPVVLTKNLPAVAAEMPHTADPDILVKNILEANATMGHLGTALQITLLAGDAIMGHEGLAVAFPAGGAANLTVVAGTMPHDGLGVEGFSPTQLPDMKVWLSPESGVVVSATNRVAQWNDKSGLGNHATQGVSAAMPVHTSAVATLNGHNTVRFRVDPERIRVTAANAVSAIYSSGLSTFTGAMVVDVSSLAAGRYFVIGQVSGTEAVVTRSLAQTSPGKYNYSELVISSTAQTFASASLGPQIIRWTHSSGNVAFWKNGASILATAKVSAGSNAVLGAGPEMYFMGRGPGDQVIVGHCAEILVASTVWSSSQGRELDKLLGAKYGITIT